MLHTVSIVTSSGVVVFKKEWKKSSGDKNFGGVLTAIQALSREASGMGVGYIALNDVGVAIVQDSNKTKLMCALFHDAEDGPAFGKLIAKTILASFIQEYPDEKWSGGGGVVNSSKFNGFNNKLLEVISGASRFLLQDLRQKRGIISALLVFDEGTPITTGKALEDQISVVANLNAFLVFASEMMATKEDIPQVITLEMSKQVIYIQRIHDASLVCVCRRSEKRNVYLDQLEEPINLLHKVFTLLGNLKG